MSTRAAGAIVACALSASVPGAGFAAAASHRPQPAGDTPAATAQASDAQAQRQQRFITLLRTYPQRRPEVTLALVGALVEEGSFPDRARAEYWLGSAQLSLGERDGARAWFSQLARDYPESTWVERSVVGLGDAAAQERRYGEALAQYRRAAMARDGSVRELARIEAIQARLLQRRQRFAVAAGALAAAVALWLCASLWRRRPMALFPLPAEVRIAGPVLAIFALLSLRQDPAPRAAVLEMACAGALLLLLSGLRLRAVPLRAKARAVHALATLAALCALSYVAIYRNDLISMVQETFRAGPE